MTTQSNPGRSIPEGYYTVTPWIIVKDSAQLIDFLKEAFGAVEIGRVYTADGTIGHAEVRIGDSMIMMFDSKNTWAQTPSFLRLYVKDSDAVYQQALKAGATSVTNMTEHFFGDRVGRVRDPFGNLWWIQTHQAVDPEEMARRAAEQTYIDAMQYFQSSLDHELSSRRSEE
jgi:PhnB protein